MDTLSYKYVFKTFATMFDAVAFLNNHEIAKENIIFFDVFRHGRIYITYLDYCDKEELL